MDATLNLNMAECMRNVQYFGFERWHNVCTGAIHDVAWGPFTWISAVLLSLTIGGMILFVLFILFIMLTARS